MGASFSLREEAPGAPSEAGASRSLLVPSRRTLFYVCSVPRAAPFLSNVLSGNAKRAGALCELPTPGVGVLSSFYSALPETTCLRA